MVCGKYEEITCFTGLMGNKNNELCTLYGLWEERRKNYIIGGTEQVV